jgi:nanoRNase/pAp phosphatase (c-di-AMP/oligoRNAs hydrolase)
MTEQQQLLDTIRSGRRLVVFLHDNPDPDAIAAGWIIGELAKHIGVRYRIVYGGKVGRAENRTMVQLLKPPIHSLEERDRPMRFLKTDRNVLVDTQPGVGNNSFPFRRLKCHIVIDHHPVRSDLQADFTDIRPEQGCCTTMLLNYFRKSSLEPSPNMATAAAYAIISETQDLGREATRQDQEALQFLMPYVRLTVLGRIRHPARTRDYYQTIARAMQRVLVSRNSCICHIGSVYSPDAVAEVADFLVAMERVTWCMVSGLNGGRITVSIRTTHRRGNAERVMKNLIRNKGKGGGHGMMAGGAVPCPDGSDYPALAELLTKRFVRQLRRRQPDNFRPLLQENMEPKG